MNLADIFSGARGDALGILGAYMMAGKTPQGLLAANQSFAEAEDRDLKRQQQGLLMKKGQLELEEMQRKGLLSRNIDQAAQNAYITPEKANSLSMGPMPDGAAPPTVKPGFDQRSFLENLYRISPLQAIEYEQKLKKDDSPITVAPGASLVDRKTMQPLYTAPKPEDLPSAIREYQFAQGQGYKGSFEQWDRERKKAGASNVSVAVNAEKSLLTNMGEGLAKSMTTAKDAAQASLGTISTVNRLNDALDSGKVMAGPGSTFRQYGLQIGQVLGVGGRDAQETLMKTRQAVQSLAQLELDAAQGMKGQGQITEAERAIIRRAASGDIDSMTAPELRVLGGVLDRTARTKIRTYNSQVKPFGTMPNASSLMPFLSVEEPPERPQGGGGVRRFNPKTGRIE